jgi:phage major capsid protein, HK97 family
MAEVKELIDGVQSAFEEFKRTNDARLKALEEGRSAGEFEEKLAKINTAIDEQQDELKALATKLNRPSLSTAAGAADFLAQVKAQYGKDAAKSIKAYFRTAPNVRGDYGKGYEQWLRTGEEKGLADLQQQVFGEFKAFSNGSDPDGGYFVHPDLSGQIVMRIWESSPVRQYAAVQTISTDKLVGFRDREDMDAGWVGETQSRPETNTPERGRWEISVHEQYAKPKVTQQHLEDAAYDVEGYLEGRIADKFGRMEAAAFVTGNGAGKPRGFTTYSTAATADATRADKTFEHVLSGADGAFKAANSNPADCLVDAVHALKADYRPGAVWMMARLTVGAVRKIKDTTGVYLWQPSLQLAQPATLLGYPIAEAEDMPALAADSLSIAFGNFRRGYQIVDRVGISTLRDPYSSKPFVEFYSRRRVGGDVIDWEAIKFVKFGD